MQRRLLAISSITRILLLTAVCCGLIAAALLAAQAIVLSLVIARVFLAGATLATLGPWLIALLALLLVRSGCLWGQELLAQRAAGTLKLALRQRLLAHLAALGPACMAGERSGELVQIQGEGVETLDEYIATFLPARYLAALTPLLVLLAILVIDPWSTLVLLFAGPLLVLLLALIGGRTKALSERRMAELNWMSAFFLDMLQGITTLKLFGRSQEQADNIETISRHYGKATMQLLATAFQTSLVLEWGATAATALVAIEVAFRLSAGMLPFEQALAVLLLTPEFFLPLRQLAARYHAGSNGIAAAQNIFALLDTPVPTTLAPPTPPAAIADLRGAPTIMFERISFAYDAGNRPVLYEFSLGLPAGQTVALIGPSGAGKSTVAALLLRFIEPDAGTILVDNQPLAAVSPEVWRRQIAWVPQRPYLFAHSVAENIRLARSDASDAEVVAAARLAGAHEFIMALPQGYGTLLGERGVRLSGGQRQRIAIARALLKQAPLLILDEPAAQLDQANTDAIYASLSRLRVGRTVLLITHRLDLANQADQIVEVRGGRATRHSWVPVVAGAC